MRTQSSLICADMHTIACKHRGTGIATAGKESPFFRTEDVCYLPEEKELQSRKSGTCPQQAHIALIYAHIHKHP